MFDLSFAEILLIVVVGIVFIGPEDLPVVIRAVAKMIKTVRDFMNEVRQTFSDLTQETGIADVKEKIEAEIRLIEGDDGKMYEAYDIQSIVIAESIEKKAEDDGKK